jgi:2-keto-4-pentenoate hydratase/2-oxohepta-3-ene-1,7-dioic acid hydratase in catechol pathway
MKIVLFQRAHADRPRPGLLTDRGIVDIAEVVPGGQTPRDTIRGLIDGFDGLRAVLERLAAGGEAVPADTVRLLSPLPQPGKIVCSTGGYGPRAAADPKPLLVTLKGTDAVVGPGDAIVLPATNEPWSFCPEAELGIVIKGPAKRVGRDGWQRAVFGYTCVIDVMPRLPDQPVGEVRFGRDYWLAKADTLSPLGPCIVTADEISDPNALRVRSWINGEPRQDYATADADYRVPEILDLATTIMTLYTGDVVAAGSSLEGTGPVQAGDTVAVEIEGIGRLSLTVTAEDVERVA